MIHTALTTRQLSEAKSAKVKHNVNLHDNANERDGALDCCEKTSRGAGLHAASGNYAISLWGGYTDAHKESP